MRSVKREPPVGDVVVEVVSPWVRMLPDGRERIYYPGQRLCIPVAEYRIWRQGNKYLRRPMRKMLAPDGREYWGRVRLCGIEPAYTWGGKKASVVVEEPAVIVVAKKEPLPPALRTPSSVTPCGGCGKRKR